MNHSYRRFFRFLKKYRLHLSITVVGSILFSALSALSISLVGVLFEIIFPEFGKPAVVSAVGSPSGMNAAKETLLAVLRRAIIGESRVDTLSHFCLLLITIFLLKNAVKYVNEVMKAYAFDSILRDIRNALYEKLCSLSLGYFNGQRSGVLISRVTNDVGALNDSLSPLFSVLITEPLQIVLFLMILLSISWQLTLVTAASSGAVLIMVRFLGRWVRRYSGRIQKGIGDVTAALQEGFANMRIVKAYGAEDRETSKFRGLTQTYFRAGQKMARTGHLTAPVNELFAIAALTIVLWNGGQQVFAGQISSSNLMLFVVTLFALMSPVNAVAGLYTQIQRGRAPADAIAAVFDEQPAVPSGPEPAPVDFELLDVRDLTFTYGALPAIEHVSFSIRRGETIALVGPSGAGKSTLADLVLRFYDPGSGSISMDGADIRSFNLQGYRRLFGVVTQEPMLFNDTIRNNIAYGMPEASDEQIREAARIANADEFIQRLPEKYNTLMGDRGTRLSGGERQRVAIARAVLPNPRILIFDEATSALDSQSELLVKQAIERLLANRTAIIIAHRLSTIQMADTILVLERGKIVQIGKHDELVQGSGLYRKLYDIQMGFDS